MVHTGTFSTDAFPKADLCKELAFEKVEHSRPDGRRELDVSKYVALVRGDIKPQYVAKSHQCYMPTTIMVVDSINCSEICRVGERAWRIATGEMPTLNCSVLDSLFSHVEDVVFLKAGPRAYDCAPLHSVNGAQAPGLVLGTRFLNAACIDRVGNDVNLDCLAARNAASFFRHGAATWK